MAYTILDKTYKVACVSSKNSDWSGHAPSLIIVFTFYLKILWVLPYLPKERTAKTDQTRQMIRLTCPHCEACHLVGSFTRQQLIINLLTFYAVNVVIITEKDRNVRDS